MKNKKVSILNPPIESMQRIIDVYYDGEKKHYQESLKPKDHIYHDLCTVAAYINKYIIEAWEVK